jgi:three-Cys-motif partner protein
MLLRYYLNPLTRILSKYFARTCYIDGFSGPGKVRFRLEGEVYDVDGSPLTALRSRPGFTDYYFCDSNRKSRDALESRVDEMALSRNVDVLPAQNFNECLPAILSTIPQDCHIFAFHDPEGLELDWRTVAAIGKRKHRELLINFSNGVFRCAKTARKYPTHADRMNSFMGLTDQWWRYSSEEILETYKNNLKALGGGFRHVLDLPVKNSIGGVVYILLFATDNDTAVKILREHMRHLEKLNTDQLRVLFLREQGEYVPDLRPFLEGASMVRKPGPDPLQSELVRFMSEGRNGFS